MHPITGVDLLSTVHVLHATQQPLINANCQTKYMYMINIYVRRTQLTACSAPHTQYKSHKQNWQESGTTQEKKTSHHTKNESRLGTSNQYRKLYTEARESLSCQPISRNFPSKNVFDVRDFPKTEEFCEQSSSVK